MFKILKKIAVFPIVFVVFLVAYAFFVMNDDARCITFSLEK